MQYWDYNENRQRGEQDFPFEFHHVDALHPQYIMPYHWHVEFEIIRILEGSFTARLEEREVCSHAGDTLFVGSGILHAGQPDEGCVYECIVFDMRTFLQHSEMGKKLIQDIIDHSALIHHYFSSENRRIQRLVWDIFDALSLRRPGYPLSVTGAFYQFFGAVYADRLYLTAPRQTPKDHRRILQLKTVLDYIDHHYASPITLNDLSRTVNMSPKYFCRFFDEMTHQTPIDYVNSRRIEHACHQLLTTSLSVTDIALNSGFSDASYFIKTFRKYKGITPGKYLRADNPPEDKLPLQAL